MSSPQEKSALKGRQNPQRSARKRKLVSFDLPDIALNESSEPSRKQQQQQQQQTRRSNPRKRAASPDRASRYATLALELMDSRSQFPPPQQSRGYEPMQKRQRLEDTSSSSSPSWIDQALLRGRFERSLSGKPDPFPFPDGYAPTLPSQQERSLLPAPVPQRRQQSYQHPLGPPDYLTAFQGGSGAQSVHLSPYYRRSTSITSATGLTRTASPVPSHGTIVSAPRYDASPAGGSSVGLPGLSDLDSHESRETSAPLSLADYGDTTATFESIHKVPSFMPAPRKDDRYTIPSRFEQLPMDVFMRILMHCDYIDQIRLRLCNYKMYQLVNLESIPWTKRTATIIQEERDNPKNFPQKAVRPSKDKGGSASGNDAVSGDDAPPKSKRSSQKTKPDPTILGRWGCYTCYKILPPHYFEGPLLEDEDGRIAKQQKRRGINPVDTDKKVDMRVEYIQVLGIVPSRPLPEWLTDSTRVIERKIGDSDDIEVYVRERMAMGVDRQDLRAYYCDVNKETQLMAPLRGVTPVFVESTHGLPRIDLENLLQHLEPSSSDLDKHDDRIHQRIAPKPNPLPFDSISAGEIPPGCETYRPLYCQGAKRALRGDAEVGRHFYELCIPHGSKRDRNHLKLPSSRPAGRIILPQKTSCNDTDYIEKPVVEIDDVIALRRICIPCGTKYGVYRRDCNRKIVSKTGEGWWVCACPKVWQTGRSRGCPDCGKRTIY